MSKLIPYIDDIHLEHASGEPLFRLPGGGATTVPNNEPYLVSQLSIMLERINDATFGDGLDAIPADIKRDDLRGELKRQRVTAQANGGWLVEDEDLYLRLANAFMKPKGQLNLEGLRFNFVCCARAVQNAKPVTEKSEAKATNGASVAAS
jgi:hypothetical protein